VHSAEFHRILLPSRNHAVCSWLEVLRRVEIGDQTWSTRPSPQPSLCEVAGAAQIPTNEACEPAKMGCRFIRGRETTGTFRPRPMASAMYRKGIPSSVAV
jgi:hypothetical protein